MSEYRYKMPDVGEGIVEAEIVEWHVKEGDKVTEDQHVLDVMTDKATVEIPCAVNGVVSKLVGEPGDVIAVGTEIMFIAIDGAVPAKEAAPAHQDEEKNKSAGKKIKDTPNKPHPEVPTKAASKDVGKTSRPAGEKPLTSPAVRKRALEADIDLALVPGSGPAGRITHQDLDDFIASGGRLSAGSGGPATGVKRTGVEVQKIIGIRRKISENMSRAQRTIPDIAYVEEIDVTALEELRAHLNANRSEDQAKLTFIPFLVMALGRALPDTPQANAHFDGEAMELTTHEALHCGVAAATPNGLMVPVIKHAEAMDIWGIAGELKRLGAAAKAGKATKDELSGSTITISSLGAIGGLVTTPIINSPEVAIIGVNKMQDLPRFDAKGRVVSRKVLNLSSCFDHRIVDGYEAATLVQRIKGYLENPATLFM